MRPSILPTLALILMVMGAGAFAAWFVMSQDETAPPPAIAFDATDTSENDGQSARPPVADTVVPPVRPEIDTPAKSAPGNKPTGTETKPDATMNKAPAPAPDAQVDKKRQERLRAQLELDRIRSFVDGNGALIEPDAGPKVPFSATIKGVVVDGSNNPVVGASVHGTSFDVANAFDGTSAIFISRVAAAGGVSGPVLATTDGAGEFTARIDKQVREGAKVSVNLGAKAPGFAASPSQNITVGNGDEKTGVKLVLPGAGSVTGRVVDAHGVGVNGARVSLSQNGGFGSLDGNGPTVLYGLNGAGGHAAVTDPAGNFKIADLAEGRYQASVSASGWRQTSGPTEVTVKAGQEITLPADFVMKAASQIKIALRDAEGNPLSKSITLSLKSETSRPQVKRLGSQDGSYTWNDAPTGSFTVTILVSGYVAVSTQCTVIDGLPTDLGSFTLEKAAPTSPSLPPSGG